MNTLKAEKRSMDIKAKKLRREGFVTGNVFGKKLAESIPVKIEKSAIEKLLKTSHKGSQIKDVEYNPLKGQVDEIDFQALVSDEKVHSVAEIELVDHEKVVYGVLEQFLEEIQLRALPAALVDKIEINVGELKVGESIKVKDLPIYQNKDIDILTDPEATIVTIQEVHNAPEADEEAEESTEA